jgi:hypothetical protein
VIIGKNAMMTEDGCELLTATEYEPIMKWEMIQRWSFFLQTELQTVVLPELAANRNGFNR